MNKWIGMMLCILSTTTIAAETSPVTANAVAETDSVYTQEKTNITVSPDLPTFTIKLESNPTTGYSWFLREYDVNLIKPMHHEMKAGDKKLIGSPGYELWTFRVKPTGFVVPQQTSIRFTYARPWDGADNSTQTVFRVSTQAK